MWDKQTEVIPRADKPLEVSSAAGSDRVKAPLVGVGRKDCGGDQSHSNSSLNKIRTEASSVEVLHVKADDNTFDEDPFKRNKVLFRTPPQNENSCGEFSQNQDTSLQERNYYGEWQKELKAREALEITIASLQQHIDELGKRILLLDKNKCLDFDVASSSNTLKNVEEYYTDEDELDRETNWILKKNKKHLKKRKATSSPVISPQNKNNDNVKIKEKYAENKHGSKDAYKQHVPPPIIVSGVKVFGELRDMIRNLTNNTECRYTSYNNNVWKINAPDSNSYRLISSHLTNEGMQWHSYEDKTVRPIKVMARGLHPSCDENEIVLDLTNKGFHILTAKNIIKKEITESRNGEQIRQRKGLQLFMLTFHNEENVNKIFAIKSVMGIGVNIEPLRKNVNLIPQCKRCQAFGHTQRYCQRDFACVKCAGKHYTNTCPLNRDQKPTCVNCKGEHPASYRGCPVAKEQQERRNRQIYYRQKDQERPNNKKTDGIVSANDTESNNKIQNTKTYSQIVRNARREEETSIKDLLLSIVQRLDNQEKSIKLLTDDISMVKNRTEKLTRTKTK